MKLSINQEMLGILTVTPSLLKQRYERKNENTEVKALRLLISFFILQF